MAVVETRYEHVVIGEDGVPLIAGTTTKVVELVVEKWPTVGVRKNFTYSIHTYRWDRSIPPSPTTGITSMRSIKIFNVARSM